MRRILSLSLPFLLLQSAFCFALLPIGVSAGNFEESSSRQETLTNQMIIDMAAAKFSQDIIIAKIKSSRNTFDTSAAALQVLKKSGVSDAVILAMVQNTSNGEEQTKNNISPSNVPAKPNEPLSFGLQDGTPVKLRIGRTLSSADAKTGETVDFEVLEDVKIGNVIIIPRGGVALGTVTQGKPKGRMGKGGKLDINIDSVRLVSGEKVALRAIKATKGGSHTGAMTGAIVATSILFFPAAPFFLFMKGKDITIPKGTEITAYINSDIPLDPSKFNTTPK